MSYIVVRDPLGRAEIFGIAELVGHRARSFIGAKKVPFRVENNKRLGGIFDGIIAQWKAAQKRWKRPFSFRAFLLGTVGASEYDGGSDQVKVAVMHSALNWERRNRWGMKLEKMLIPDGKFGEQAGRYASTNRTATLRDVLLAEKVLAGEIPDPTGGAIQFDAPRTQKILHKQNPRMFKHPDVVAKDRQNAGLHPVYLAQEDPGLARFWRPFELASR